MLTNSHLLANCTHTHRHARAQTNLHKNTCTNQRAHTHTHTIITSNTQSFSDTHLLCLIIPEKIFLRRRLNLVLAVLQHKSPSLSFLSPLLFSSYSSLPPLLPASTARYQSSTLYLPTLFLSVTLSRPLSSSASARPPGTTGLFSRSKWHFKLPLSSCFLGVYDSSMDLGQF